MNPPIWISERDVEKLSMAEAAEALRKGLRREAESEAVNLEKTHVGVGGGANMHAIGAAFPTDALCGIKAWVHTKGGANPIELLWDSQDGHLLAVIEAFALGQLRTSAIAGIATDVLALPEADELAICGAGKQALAQVATVASVRRLSRVRVFGRDVERREKMCGRIEAELGLRAEGFGEVDKAVADAPIITTITRAAEPFLESGMVSQGCHINAMGAISRERGEFAAEILNRCSTITADNIPQARALASEFRTFFGDDDEAWQSVVPLCQLVDRSDARPSTADVTLFKSLGMGISDLSLAREVYDRAKASGSATELPIPKPAPLRFRPSTPQTTPQTSEADANGTAKP